MWFHYSFIPLIKNFQELSQALSSLFQLCDQTKSMCQLQEGSLLGAVKFSSILPWERDADIAILSADFHKVVNLHKKKPIGKMKICKYIYGIP